MFKYFPLGDSSFIIKFGDQISPEINNSVRTYSQKLRDDKLDGIAEIIPAYNELVVSYDRNLINYKKLLTYLKSIEKSLFLKKITKRKIVHIPVCYENEFALDIDIVSSSNNLSIDDVIKIHSSAEYLVYMLGFTPGFCYLGGMDNRIETPRKEIPRTKINAGAVGIAGKQTGIYPIESPGGWQIIGKTPLILFDPLRIPEFLIEAGDYIKFDPISINDFKEIESKLIKGVYNLNVELRNE